MTRLTSAQAIEIATLRERGWSREPSSPSPIETELTRHIERLVHATIAAAVDRLPGLMENDGRLADLARYEAARRKAHRRALGPHADLLHGPGWDMMLAIGADTDRDRPCSVSSACHAAHVPATTALGHIMRLERRGLLARAAHPRDRRAVHLSLTGAGEQLLTVALRRAA